MGQSSALTKKSQYTMTIMVKDAIALIDHLGWVKPHVFGHSMGMSDIHRAMIACKLAAMAPNRILSLALLNVTGGGFECFPKVLGKKNVVILVDEQHKIFDPLNPFVFVEDLINFLRRKTNLIRKKDTHETTKQLPYDMFGEIDDFHEYIELYLKLPRNDFDGG
ncbi:hypothetical protein GIB67_042654 [Kingdonia uniflora]|uniref:AB hydrolase-1 domain-containing protein n=1 Tax=Kingdonia uniflora TaxID=39325 RepID=A0A7J7P2Y0_9MAGN|nr:hypothetical protein GIB67_042654 [Kingdonia uniflora]